MYSNFLVLFRFNFNLLPFLVGFFLFNRLICVTHKQISTGYAFVVIGIAQMSFSDRLLTVVRLSVRLSDFFTYLSSPEQRGQRQPNLAHNIIGKGNLNI